MLWLLRPRIRLRFLRTGSVVCLASGIPLRATAFVLPEQSIEETYAWPLSTAFTSEHPSSLNPPNSSTKLTQCGPTLWLFFVNNTSVNVIQAAVEITLINPGNLNLPIDFSLPLILRSFVPSFLPCFLLSLNILMSTVYQVLFQALGFSGASCIPH